MEDFFIVVLLIGFVFVLVRQRSLGRRVRELEAQFDRLPAPQAAPLARTAPLPAVAAPAPQVAAQQSAPPAAAPYRATYIPPPPPAAPPRGYAPPPPTFAAPAPAAKPKERVSLEARLGQNWLNKLGIAALVIGLALGLGKLITHIGPLGKSLIGFALAVGILGLGVWLERRPDYRVFARACIGGGWALTFFLSFAIYHVPLLHCLDSQIVDLLLMFAVAAAMVAHSLRYRSQTVTSIAFLLAFVTVGLSEMTLFSLVAGAVLAASLCCIVARERWYALGLAGLVGVYVNHFLWLHRVLPDGGRPGHSFPEFVPSAALLLSYWLIFRLVYVLRPPLEGREHDLNQTLATFAAVLNSVGLLALLKYQSSHPEWAFYGLLTLGLAELGLSLLARGSVLGGDEVKPRNRVAFVTLSSIAMVVLLTAVPFRYGSSWPSSPAWPLLWLLEAEAFFVVGVRLPEAVFRRLGMLANFALACYLVCAAGALLFVPNSAGTSTGLAVTVVGGALVLWLNAEFFTRRFPSVAATGFDRLALRVTSYLGALLAALGISVFLNPLSSATDWIGVALLLLALALAFIADRLNSRDLATQSDLIAVAGVIYTLSVDIFLQTETWHGVSLRLLTMGATAALLYLGMRRTTAAYLLSARFIAAAYSWAAGGTVALLCWYELQPVSVAVAWGVFALVLFELGVLFRKDYLRHQAYALLAGAFVRIFFANMQVAAPNGGLSPSLFTVLPLIAAFSWVYERSRSLGTRLDAVAGAVFDCCGLTALFALLYFEVRPAWVVLAWTLVTVAVLALAALMKRRLFVAQAIVLLLPVAGHALFFQLFSTAALAVTFFTSTWFTVGATCALLLLALPLAFSLRFVPMSQNRDMGHPANDLSSRPEAEGRSGETPVFVVPPWLAAVLHRPEQPWFFVPLALLTVLFYVQLSGGLITIGWVALGLCAFLFALAVKERSYRLSGLGLLLLGVAKVLLWDVWHVAPTQRYLTLIVMGAALLLVSFLYSRYRETLLKLL